VVAAYIFRQGGAGAETIEVVVSSHQHNWGQFVSMRRWIFVSNFLTQQSRNPGRSMYDMLVMFDRNTKILGRHFQMAKLSGG